MNTTVRAVYRRGLFEPLEAPEGIAENQTIELEIRPLPPVSSDPRIMGGQPCITGTRIPIDWVMGYLEAGRSLNQFLNDYPQYTAVGRSADAAEVIKTLAKVLRLFPTAASLREKKVIAHAAHCTVLTESGSQEVPYPS